MESAFSAPTLQPGNPFLAGDHKILQEKQFKILYRAEVTTYVTQKDKYQANESKAYALIYSWRNKAMHHKLQLRTNCESAIKGDPIKLLDAISEHSTSDMQNNCHASMVVDGIKNFINLQQKDEESLVD